jgi:5-methylcytosine-specific restriction endonuclease McrA
MSGPIFVQDAQGTPLMPMASAHARKLLQSGKVCLRPHHAFTIVRLSRTVTAPVLRPVVLGITVHERTAELALLAEGVHAVHPLLTVIVDLRTDIPWRMRRRAAHRRRRRYRGRYRRPRRARQPRPKSRRLVTSPRPSFPTTIRWRAEAIERVITALRALVPISHIVLLAPHTNGEPDSTRRSSADRRQQLIACYGVRTPTGARRAMCAYCGTTTGQIVVDHILPQSRGGTDRWSNLVLACAACNARKGDRTPEEAGMPLRVHLTADPGEASRALPYTRQTAHLLEQNLAGGDVPVYWMTAHQAIPHLSDHLVAALRDIAAAPNEHAPVFVARPISRPRKQVFTARNYPLSTPEGGPFVRVGTTIKRRVRVNEGLALWREQGEIKLRVIARGAQPPDAAQHVVRLGMLCEGQRAGQMVRGIVAAVHSSGRLTLLVLQEANRAGIAWERVVISPRQHLRVLSSDRVVFLPYVPPSPEDE